MSARRRQGDGSREMRPAFTLLELLIVIAIIALLIAILLPSLRMARRHSQRIQCLSNLRQLGIAWDGYLADSGGRFLKARVLGPDYNVNFGGRQGRGARAFGADPTAPVPKPFNRYVNLPTVVQEGAEVFQCPSDDGTAQARPTCFEFYGTSYKPNVLFVGYENWSINPGTPCAGVFFQVLPRLVDHGVSERMPDPARLVRMGDWGWVGDVTPWMSPAATFHVEPSTHNLLFNDGHADFTRVSKGLYTTDRYIVLPWTDLSREVCECQREGSDF